MKEQSAQTSSAKTILPYSDAAFLLQLGHRVGAADIEDFVAAVPDFSIGGRTRRQAILFAARPLQSRQFPRSCRMEFTDGLEHMLHVAADRAGESPYRDIYFSALALHCYRRWQTLFSDDIASLASLTISSSISFLELNDQLLSVGFLLSRTMFSSFSDREGAVGCLALLAAMAVSSGSLLESCAKVPMAVAEQDFDEQSTRIWKKIATTKDCLRRLSRGQQEKVMKYTSRFENNR